MRSFANPRRSSPFRGFQLWIEKARLAGAIAELGGLIDIPHDIADCARARLERLARRERALVRLLG
jgi:hypothetical protein